MLPTTSWAQATSARNNNSGVPAPAEVLYTDFDYMPAITVGGDAVTGALSGPVKNVWPGISTAAWHSFNAVEGEAYRIIVDYTSSTDIGGMGPGVDILTSRDLAGDHDDFIGRYMGHGRWTELTINETFVSNETGLVRILLQYYGGGDLNYSIRIIEDHDCDWSVEKIVTKAPTCMRDGEKAYMCSICGAKRDLEYIDADLTNHDLVWNVTTPAKCEAAGVETQSCQRPGCTHVAGTRAVTALVHDLVWNVTTPAKCEVAGVETQSCQRPGCTHTTGVTQPIAALQHTMGAWTVKTPATSTAKGVEERKCTRTGCTHSETRDIAMVSVLVYDHRVLPPNNDNVKDAAVVVPVNTLSAEFTAGPNPVSKSAGNIGFFYQGKRIDNAALTIYDASGNFIRKIAIRDDFVGTRRAVSAVPASINPQSRRQTGEWDLRDGKGRPVSEGTYVVKGVLKSADGKTEKISLILGVR